MALRERKQGSGVLTDLEQVVTMAAIRKSAQQVQPKIALEEASHDDDNRFLECAQASKAPLLGDGQYPSFSGSVEVQEDRPAERVADALAGPKAARRQGLELDLDQLQIRRYDAVIRNNGVCMSLQTYVTKNENIYCAFSPQLEVIAYGACREEALNGLREEVDRQGPKASSTRSRYE